MTAAMIGRLHVVNDRVDVALTVGADDVPALVRAGAHGVAVISAITAAPDPAAAAARLLRALIGVAPGGTHLGSTHL
ncbi:MAG: hypothetical protein QG622_803 [Actinomycetota bacterium]|nr:hypothetical protein [Actinomycetota bacterium]